MLKTDILLSGWFCRITCIALHDCLCLNAIRRDKEGLRYYIFMCVCGLSDVCLYNRCFLKFDCSWISIICGGWAVEVRDGSAVLYI